MYRCTNFTSKTPLIKNASQTRDISLALETSHRSLAIRLVACGFRVVVGSRNPNRIDRGLFPDGVDIRSQKEAVDSAERVVFAVLVDVSSATRLNSGEQSNAEKLAELFPESRVVKGFNVISAWALQAGVHDGSRQEKAFSSFTCESVWRSDLYLSCGILGFGVLTLLAITSLPSVGNAFNWREFTFVQSGLGYTALTLSIMHTLFFGWDFAFFPVAYPYYLPPMYLLALILPCIVLVGRLFLALPCLTLRLAKIRRGWESARHWPRNNQEPRSNEADPPQNVGDV
uniref:STEAP3 metalloreductase n=1 Tax=Lates calcarifer TaxID=8187 RepID=A0A4W6CXF7_LATCA